MLWLTIFSTELETKPKESRGSGGPSNGSCREVNDTKENGLPQSNFRNSLHVTALSSFVFAFTWNCSSPAVDCFFQGTRCRSVLLSIGNKIAIDSSYISFILYILAISGVFRSLYLYKVKRDEKGLKNWHWQKFESFKDLLNFKKMYDNINKVILLKKYFYKYGKEWIKMWKI